MSETTKVTPDHLQRSAFVYVRQSTTTQVEHHRESTARQYQLVDQAVKLGWPRPHIEVVDQDLGVSGSGAVERSGFAYMTAEVALGRVGIILALEVSRLARNNADWYRLLDLCSVTDTLIGDADGIYHPGLFNDRLVLGLKGTMSEAELHVMRARLEGGIRNKAARGELRRGLPVGMIWGDEDGEIRFHPDEAVTGAVRTVFERFAELGSARRVWLWLLTEGFRFPLKSSTSNTLEDIRWMAPTYAKIHQVLTNPVYAGAYAYGKTRHERYVDDHGQVRKRVRRLPRSEWQVLVRAHHEGFVDWDTFEQIEARLAANRRPRRDQPGEGAVREGAALLQGLASRGRCGRALRVDYGGRNATPGYYCTGQRVVQDQAVHCLRVGGQRIEQAVATAVLASLDAAGLGAALKAAEQVESDHAAVVAQWQREVERWRYQAQRAERRYRAVDPDNRLVARGLEAEWEESLRQLQTAQSDLDRRQRKRPHALTAAERDQVLSLGIAGVLNRQGRRTATGLPFTANRVSSLRTQWGIPCYQPVAEAPCAGLLVHQVAKRLGVVPSTVHRWLNDGIIAGEQLTPGAPWRIRMTEELRSRFVEEAPQGFVPMDDAMRILGVSRQTVLQRVKRGELDAVHVRRGRRIRIENQGTRGSSRPF